MDLLTLAIIASCLLLYVLLMLRFEGALKAKTAAWKHALRTNHGEGAVLLVMPLLGAAGLLVGILNDPADSTHPVVALQGWVRSVVLPAVSAVLVVVGMYRYWQHRGAKHRR